MNCMCVSIQAMCVHGDWGLIVAVWGSVMPLQCVCMYKYAYVYVHVCYIYIYMHALCIYACMYT